MADHTAIDQEVDAAETTIWDVASTLWGDAELGYKEFQSSAYVSETLEQHGFAIGERSAGGIDTSWVATFGISEHDGAKARPTRHVQTRRRLDHDRSPITGGGMNRNDPTAEDGSVVAALHTAGV